MTHPYREELAGRLEAYCGPDNRLDIPIAADIRAAAAALRQSPTVEEVARVIDPDGWREFDNEASDCRFWGVDLNPVPNPARWPATAESLRAAERVADLYGRGG